MAKLAGEVKQLKKTLGTNGVGLDGGGVGGPPGIPGSGTGASLQVRKQAGRCVRSRRAVDLRATASTAVKECHWAGGAVGWCTNSMSPTV